MKKLKYQNKYKSNDANYHLRCKHCIGDSCYYYTMPCIILKEMPDKLRYKVIVFGDRYWEWGTEIQHIRYVLKWRVINGG